LQLAYILIGKNATSENLATHSSNDGA